MDKYAKKNLEIYLNKYFHRDDRIKCFKDRRFYSLEVELTNRCNRECNYCYNNSCIASRQPDLPLETVQKLLQEASEYGIKSISWLGGEPTLYADLEKVLAASKSLGIENILFTNGSLLDQELWQKVRPLVDRIMLHIDTIEEETFIKLNRIPAEDSKKVFDGTFNNIENILHSGFDADNIIIYIVLARPTLNTLKQTMKWAIEEKGFGTTMLYPMVRAGRGKDVNQSMNLSTQEIKSAFELRADIEERPELLLLGPSEYCKQYQLTMAYIRNDGRVVPYAGMPDDYGDIFNESLSRILSDKYSDLAFESLVNSDGTNNIYGFCGTCDKSEFCFGTRTSALNEIGSASLTDPFCWQETC